MLSIRLKSELKVGLLLRLYTAVRSKSILNHCYIEYLLKLKSKYEKLLKLDFCV